MTVWQYQLASFVDDDGPEMRVHLYSVSRGSEITLLLAAGNRPMFCRTSLSMTTELEI